MPAITQTANDNSIWNGTVVATPGIGNFRVYAAQGSDHPTSYRYVKDIANPGDGNPLVLGPITYGKLFLISPHRKFWVKVTTILNGRESDIANELALPVVPSPVIGWTLGQLQEMTIRPTMLVGFDPASGMFYPLNVVPDLALGGFKLKVDNS